VNKITGHEQEEEVFDIGNSRLRSSSDLRLLGAYVGDKVRFSYFSDIGKFILHMPTALHDIAARKLTTYIVQQGKAAIIEDDPNGDVDRLTAEGTSDIKFTYGNDKHAQVSPDDQICYGADAYWPSIVIQITYSNPPRQSEVGAMMDAAKSYIHATLVLNIAYKSLFKRGREELSTIEPTLSLYRYDDRSDRPGTTIIFKNDDIRAKVATNPASSAQLQLWDFDSKFSRDKAVHLYYSDLLSIAEAAAQRQTNKDRKPPLKPPQIIGKRARTPLRSSDDDYYEKKEVSSAEVTQDDVATPEDARFPSPRKKTLSSSVTREQTRNKKYLNKKTRVSL